MKTKLLKIEKAIICGLLITVTAATVSGLSVFAQQYKQITTDVLRLHILANSDSNSDQQLKLNVRDKILAQSAELFQNAASRAEAEANVRPKLPEIEAIAEAEIKKEGYNYPVKAELVNMYFPNRTYGDITLPAGYYDAVRVTIGAAKGHNWWCVLYPALCLPTADEKTSQKIGDVLSPGEVYIVKNTNKPDIAIKLKSVELFEQFECFLQTNFSSFINKYL
jgi:stage II sporulation protein R